MLRIFGWPGTKPIAGEGAVKQRLFANVFIGVKMDLGQFSISLAVKNIKTSCSFYEKFGFEVIDGAHLNSDFPLEEGQDWLVLKQGTTYIGLFQGMFDKNILTFNPPDVRAVQRQAKKLGVSFDLEANEQGGGAANAMLKDPDDNQILLDQH